MSPRQDATLNTMARMPEPLILTIRGRAPSLHARKLGRAQRDPDRSGDPRREGQRLVRRHAAGGGRAHRDRFGTNIQDGVTIHVDPGFPVSIGANVSVGHNAVLHGCEVEDGCLIGMGAVILNGAKIGAGSLIAASALVPQGFVVPPRSLVAGVPGKMRRDLSDAEVAHNRNNAQVYQALVELHRDANGS